MLPSVSVSPSNITVRLEHVADIPFASDMAKAPDGSGRLFLVDLRSGDLRVLDNSGALLATPYHSMLSNLSVLDRDTGFTAMAFHPGFGDSQSPGYGKFYTLEPESTATGPVTYTPQFGSSSTHHYDVLYEYTVADPTANTIGSFDKRALIRARQSNHNHNLNDLEFDANELLYISSGDGSNSSLERLNAQQLTTPYGKVLRIDPLGLQGVTSSNGQFSIPATNPFFGQGGGVYEEIFTYGNRNPYRISIDGVTNDLYIAEVGQDDVEEINLAPNVLAEGSGGQNYGWHYKEGSIRFPSLLPDADQDGNGNGDLADLNGWLDPVLEYDHQDGADVIGGNVYRGDAILGLEGMYVFADHQGSRDPSEPIPNLGRLFYGDVSSGITYEFNFSSTSEVLPPRVIGLGEGHAGELYVMGYDQNFSGGRLLRIEPVLYGDFNADGVVNLADYTVWRNNLGAASEEALHSAGSADGIVDVADYNLWKSHFGMTLPQAAQPGTVVPEPSTWAVLMLAVLVALAHRQPGGRVRVLLWPNKLAEDGQTKTQDDEPRHGNPSRRGVRESSATGAQQLLLSGSDVLRRHRVQVHRLREARGVARERSEVVLRGCQRSTVCHGSPLPGVPVQAEALRKIRFG